MYVARDENGDLYLFQEKPVKYSVSWQPSDSLFDWIKLDTSLFPEVNWEDEEPTEVELVKKGELNESYNKKGCLQHPYENSIKQLSYRLSKKKSTWIS